MTEIQGSFLDVKNSSYMTHLNAKSPNSRPHSKATKEKVEETIMAPEVGSDPGTFQSLLHMGIPKLVDYSSPRNAIHLKLYFRKWYIICIYSGTSWFKLNGFFLGVRTGNVQIKKHWSHWNKSKKIIRSRPQNPHFLKTS